MAVFKVCPYVGVSLYSLHVPNVFTGRAEFDVNTSQVFPQAVLAAITVVGCKAGAGGARAGARCEEGLLLCSVAIKTPAPSAPEGSSAVARGVVWLLSRAQGTGCGGQAIIRDLVCQSPRMAAPSMLRLT